MIGADWKSTEIICCPQGDTVRHEIIERYRPGEDDPYLRILQAAHIEDDEYFSHMIHDDISVIVRDIRAAHKSDSESALPTTIAEELKQDLEDVANFKGSPLEKQAALYCKRLPLLHGCVCFHVAAVLCWWYLVDNVAR